jgi:hypothetical protein
MITLDFNSLFLTYYINFDILLLYEIIKSYFDNNSCDDPNLIFCG